jgi:hypothetical protein
MLLEVAEAVQNLPVQGLMHGFGNDSHSVPGLNPDPRTRWV